MPDVGHFLDELALYLRPPGQGVHAVTTGIAERDAATRRYLGVSNGTLPDWRRHLEGLTELRGADAVAILALPSDVGAGIRRGAQWGPQAIREALGTAPCFELGDVFSVPHLLDDESLSAAQKDRVRAAVIPSYPTRNVGNFRRRRSASPSRCTVSSAGSIRSSG